MARATTSRFEGKIVAVEETLGLRKKAPKAIWAGYEFHCIQCHKRVRPHKASATMAAHFEHHARNQGCSLSDPLRGQ